MNITEDVVVTYLELALDPAAPAVDRPSALTFAQVPRERAAEVAARMYRDVGAPWLWTDRLGWDDARWADAVAHDGAEVWLASVAGEIAGYFELVAEPDTIELKYFGLLPAFTGRHLGVALLDAAIVRAQARGALRVTVNTCTLDHPAALPNYLRRGFSVVRTERRVARREG